MDPKFCLVRFLQPMVEPHACVPASWVHTRRARDNMVGVLFPGENPRMAERQAARNEPPSEDWPEHYCQLLSTDNEYEDLKLEAMNLNLKHRQGPAEGQGGKRKVSFKADTPPAKKSFEAFQRNERDITTLVKCLEQLKSHATLMLKNLKSATKHIAPTQFNPNDGRWTLRYQSPSAGLQELVPGTNIYIREDRIREITGAGGYDKLIRALLLNVFNDHALSFCTLNYSNKRLDKEAVAVIVEYVFRMGQVKRWEPISYNEIKDRARETLRAMKGDEREDPTLNSLEDAVLRQVRTREMGGCCHKCI